MPKQFDITESLDLIAKGGWIGMGRDWMQKKAAEAKTEIETLRLLVEAASKAPTV